MNWTVLWHVVTAIWMWTCPIDSEVANGARDDLAQVDKLEEIADKFFISDGYAGVEEFWNRLRRHFDTQ